MQGIMGAWPGLALMGLVAFGCKPGDRVDDRTKPAARARTQSEPQLPIDLPVAFTGVWIASLDGRSANIRLEVVDVEPSHVAIQLRRELPPEMAIGADAVREHLGCLDALTKLDLGTRVPVEFTPGHTLTLTYGDALHEASVRRLWADCEEGRDLVVELELDRAVPESKAVGAKFGVALTGEAARVGARLRQGTTAVRGSDEEFAEWDAALVEAVQQDFERVRGPVEARLEERFDLDALIEDAKGPEYFWRPSVYYTSWRVPSAKAEHAAQVSQNFDALSPAGHVLSRIYALSSGGQVLPATTPRLEDQADRVRDIEEIGTIDIDGDGDEELVIWIGEYLAAGAESWDEVFDEVAQSWTGLVYFDREDQRFETVRLSGVSVDEYFDHPE